MFLREHNRISDFLWNNRRDLSDDVLYEVSQVNLGSPVFTEAIKTKSFRKKQKTAFHTLTRLGTTAENRVIGESVLMGFSVNFAK